MVLTDLLHRFQHRDISVSTQNKSGEFPLFAVLASGSTIAAAIASVLAPVATDLLKVNGYLVGPQDRFRITVHTGEFGGMPDFYDPNKVNLLFFEDCEDGGKRVATSLNSGKVDVGILTQLNERIANGKPKRVDVLVRDINSPDGDTLVGIQVVDLNGNSHVEQVDSDADLNSTDFNLAPNLPGHGTCANDL